MPLPMRSYSVAVRSRMMGHTYKLLSMVQDDSKLSAQGQRVRAAIARRRERATRRDRACDDILPEGPHVPLHGEVAQRLAHFFLS